MKERLKGDGETETTSQEACVAALQGAWCSPARPRSWLPLSRPQRSSWIVQAAKPHRFQGPEGSAGSPPVPAASRYRPCVQITELPVLICPGHLQGLPSLLLGPRHSFSEPSPARLSLPPSSGSPGSTLLNPVLTSQASSHTTRQQDATQR